MSKINPFEINQSGVSFSDSDFINDNNNQVDKINDQQDIASSQAAQQEQPEILVEIQTINGENVAQTEPASTVPVSQIDYDAILKEKTNGKFEKWEDVLSLIEENNNQKHEFPNEFSEKIYELIKEQKVDELADVLNRQRELNRVADMTPEEKVKMAMRYQNPEWSNEDIEEEFNNRFGVEKNVLNTDELSEEEEQEYKRKILKQEKAAQRQLKKAAREADEFLNSMKSEIKLPEISNKKEKTEEKEKDVSPELLKEIENYRNLYLESLKNAKESISGFEFRVNDKDINFNGNFTLTPEERDSYYKKLENFNINEYYGNRYFKDGKYDAKQLIEDVYWLENKQRIVSSVITQALSKAKLEVTKQIKNIDLSGNTKPAVPTPSDEISFVKSFLGV